MENNKLVELTKRLNEDCNSIIKLGMANIMDFGDIDPNSDNAKLVLLSVDIYNTSMKILDEEARVITEMNEKLDKVLSKIEKIEENK